VHSGLCGGHGGRDRVSGFSGGVGGVSGEESITEGQIMELEQKAYTVNQPTN
jgi:hypothetical protein